jgi:hypothetical protein
VLRVGGVIDDRLREKSRCPERGIGAFQVYASVL